MRSKDLVQSNSVPSFQKWISDQVQHFFIQVSVLFLLVTLASMFAIQLRNTKTLLDQLSESFLKSQVTNLQLFDYSRIQGDLNSFIPVSLINSATFYDVSDGIIASWPNQVAIKSNENKKINILHNSLNELFFDSARSEFVFLYKIKSDLNINNHGASLQLRISVFSILKEPLIFTFILIIILSLIWIIYKKRFQTFSQTLATPIGELSIEISHLESIQEFQPLTLNNSNSFIETAQLKTSFVNLIQKLKESEQKRFQIERNVSKAEIANQVAHDIRSPLSALNIITGSLSDVPEEKRLLIRNSVQRINDIANDLLQKGKSVQNKLVSESKRNMVLPKQNYNFLISTIVDNIVSEKRIQFREKIKIQIAVDLKHSFGLFVNANPNELSRVISNLINNSVEALPNQSGNVDVLVFADPKNKVCVQIKDNGSGIPKHILVKLGQAGVSHGKENTQSGSGLGVYHAMKTIQEFGGKIIFQSVTSEDLAAADTTTSANTANIKKSEFNSNSLNKTGTTITIELPKSDTPAWFADSIQLMSGQEFVTVDDDISIHQIWKGRLESLKSKEQNIKITSFTSAKEFRNFFNKIPKCKLNENPIDLEISSDKQIIFLIDYEFLNQDDNGLKIITDLGIQEKAILVTSRFDEPNIRSECEAQKIKILPKQLAGQIPIVIQSKDISILSLEDIVMTSTDSVSFENLNNSNMSPNLNSEPVLNSDSISNPVLNNLTKQMKLSKYDLCLIDDDKLLVHSIWGMVAKEKGLNIKMFERPEDFLSEACNINKSTPIYIDVSLGNNVNGVDVANAIHEQGFENINLATGYDSETIKAPSFIRQVTGKDFPNLA